MNAIINLYNQGLALIPATYRLPIAILILFFLIFALVNFLKKHLLWVVVFVVLLPAAWPSIKQIYEIASQWVTKIPK